MFLEKNLAADVGPRESMKKFGCTFDCVFLCMLNQSNLLYAIASNLEKEQRESRCVLYFDCLDGESSKRQDQASNANSHLVSFKNFGLESRPINIHHLGYVTGILVDSSTLIHPRALEFASCAAPDALLHYPRNTAYLVYCSIKLEG